MARAAKTAAAVERPARDGQRTAKAIEEAAADLFYEHGYEATSLREISAAVGIQVGSLYNHITGKDELLTSIMTTVMHDLMRGMAKAIEGVDDPVKRLEAGFDHHIRFHAEHRRETFIGNSELRALTPEARGVVLGLRREYELTLRELITQAVEAGGGEIIDVKLSVYAVLSLGAHVASWYKPGRVSLDRIVDVYTTMIFRTLLLERP